MFIKIVLWDMFLGDFFVVCVMKDDDYWLEKKSV